MRILVLLSILASLNCYAEEQQLCKPEPVDPTDSDSLIRPTGASINISADHLQSLDDKTLLLEGNVVALRTNDSIASDELIVEDDTLIAKGTIVYQEDKNTITAASASINQNNNQGTFNDAELFSAENHATIQAKKIQQLDDEKKVLEEVRYTTCKPDKPYWQIRAKDMTLNEKSGRGYARHMRLNLFNVPIFYFPAFSFPIDDRRATGLLYPSYADSDERGTEITIPWYWNIAPQADATLTARSMSKRGWQLNSEWRYLNSYSNNLLHTENLDDELFGEQRWFYHFNQSAQLPLGWQSQISTFNLRDPEHLDDLDSEYRTNDNYLKRYARFNKSFANSQLNILAQDYEFADSDATDANAPYEFLPRISFNTAYKLKQWQTGLQSEYTQFDHNTRTDTGQRWINQLTAERKFGAPGWFIKPRLNAHLSRYDVDTGEEFNRSLPIFSIDSGLIFDRFTDNIQQTLEPRLFVLYVPFEEQSNLPNYDSSLATENYNQLFSHNRFSGQDRVGDARQISLGLSSRIYSLASGQESARLQIGQSYYLDDQDVSIDGSTIDDREKSNIYTGVRWLFTPNWQLNSDIAWKNSQNPTRESRFSLQYRRDNNHLFYLSHNTDNQGLEQIDINGRLRLKGSRWTVLGKYFYDLENQQNINRFFGLEYENCCIALRLVQQRLLEDNQQNDTLTLQLSLKGLSTIGQLNDSIATGINNFTDTFD